MQIQTSFKYQKSPFLTSSLQHIESLFMIELPGASEGGSAVFAACLVGGNKTPFALLPAYASCSWPVRPIKTWLRGLDAARILA